MLDSSRIDSVNELSLQNDGKNLSPIICTYFLCTFLKLFFFILHDPNKLYWSSPSSIHFFAENFQTKCSPSIIKSGSLVHNERTFSLQLFRTRRFIDTSKNVRENLPRADLITYFHSRLIVSETVGSRFHRIASIPDGMYVRTYAST